MPRSVPVPAGLSATIDRSDGIATLHYGRDEMIDLQLDNDEIQAVCPLASKKLVSFGFNNVGYTVNIVDLERGSVADSFFAYDPIMSPDRRWIASRHFVPPQAEVQISEEYLLYDLNSSAAENRHPDAQTSLAEGWAMYPAFPNGAPADLLDMPDAARHQWRSQAFFWSPDSQSLVFADSIGNRLSLVLVLIANGRPRAYTHAVSSADVCGRTGGNNRSITLTGASINSVAGAFDNVSATFADSSFDSRNECQPRPLDLNIQDFLPAKLEAYPHRILKESIGIRANPK